MRLHEIFTPNDLPTVTYVERADRKFEETLLAYYKTPNIVISVVGPSKSGKTVLIKKIIPEDQIIPVVGSGIKNAEELWDRVLSWMGAPSETSNTVLSSNNLGGCATVSGKVGIPLLAEGEAGVTASVTRTWGKEKLELYKRAGLPQVIKEIGGSEFIVFIDDFHYIDEKIHEEIGRQIKSACDNGVKIICASVPHRVDDVVRSNPELRGRVGAIDMGYWLVEELIQIARKGFAALNVEISPALERRLATEALGSPQLMQVICLNICYVIGVIEAQAEQVRIDINEAQIAEALLRTSAFADFTKITTALHAGARTRGTERKLYKLSDRTQGDVYRAILLALRSDPARLSFNYDEITSRVRSVCIDGSPAGSSITSALEQMHIIAEEIQPKSAPLFWDGDALDISDPYFMFYIRSSDKINKLS